MPLTPYVIAKVHGEGRAVSTDDRAASCAMISRGCQACAYRCMSQAKGRSATAIYVYLTKWTDTAGNGLAMAAL